MTATTLDEDILRSAESILGERGQPSPNLDTQSVAASGTNPFTQSSRAHWLPSEYASSAAIREALSRAAYATDNAVDFRDNALEALQVALYYIAGSELGLPTIAFRFETPRNSRHGDLAANIALRLASAAGAAPRDISERLVFALNRDFPELQSVFRDVTALNGFVNFFFNLERFHEVVGEILRAGDDYAKKPATGEKISLEFGSANPTGPLAVVQGRTLSVGDTLHKILEHQGNDVFTEWIINDAGNQIAQFGQSVYARYRELFEPDFPFPEDGYAGDYVKDIAAKLRARDGDRWLHVPPEEAYAVCGRFGRDVMVAEQQETARRFGVEFDLWQSEQELHDAGAVEHGIERLRQLDLLYEKDGATWVRTTQSGDDEDRVLIRSDRRPTYYANDVAYHYDKLQRADHVIDILGPDHHGYIERLRALAQAYGRAGAIEVLIAQQITLKRGDELLKMSKRAGNLITLDEVIDEVGVDAARFFFVMLSLEQPLTFDLELAKKQSNDNPVYYVQYGHARIASVLRKAAEGARASLDAAKRGESLERLTDPAELSLIRRLAEFGPTLAGAAKARAPHRLPNYARSVASDFHQFYDACRVLGDDAALTTARLALCMATKTVLAVTLRLCGVSAPESM